MKINLNKFFRDHRACVKHGTLYQWGAKPGPSNNTPDESDCSGYVRWQVERRGVSVVPGSSVEQRDWFLKNTKHNSAEPQNPLTFHGIITDARHDGGRLFVAGFNLGGTHRHIFFVCAGVTYECGAALHGVGSRPAVEFLDEVVRAGWCAEIPVELT